MFIIGFCWSTLCLYVSSFFLFACWCSLNWLFSSSSCPSFSRWFYLLHSYSSFLFSLDCLNLSVIQPEADRMKRHNVKVQITRLHIPHIRPHLLISHWQTHLISGLIPDLIPGLISGLIPDLIKSLISGLISGLIPGLISDQMQINRLQITRHLKEQASLYCAHEEQIGLTSHTDADSHSEWTWWRTNLPNHNVNPFCSDSHQCYCCEHSHKHSCSWRVVGVSVSWKRQMNREEEPAAERQTAQMSLKSSQLLEMTSDVTLNITPVQGLISMSQLRWMDGWTHIFTALCSKSDLQSSAGENWEQQQKTCMTYLSLLWGVCLCVGGWCHWWRPVQLLSVSNNNNSNSGLFDSVIWCHTQTTPVKVEQSTVSTNWILFHFEWQSST